MQIYMYDGLMSWSNRSSIARTLNVLAPYVLSLFRLVVGLTLLLYGTSLLFGWPMPPAAPLLSWPLWWAGVIELIAGACISAGFLTRPAAFIASGVMAVAYFWQHFPAGFWPMNNGGTPAVVMCFAFLLLVFTGPGAIAARTGPDDPQRDEVRPPSALQ